MNKSEGVDMRIGFTGTRMISEADRAVILSELGKLPAGASYTTGGCVGVDSLVGYTVASWYPHAKHVVMLPNNRKLVDEWWTEVGTDVRLETPGDYRARNKAIVENSDLLVVFAEYPEGDPRSRRSGTWMTARMARRAGVRSKVIVLTPDCT